MTKDQAKQVTEYMMNWLEHLDGLGLVFEDERLVKKELAFAESKRWAALEKIIKGGKNAPS